MKNEIIRYIGRIGYLARAALYFSIGLLAIFSMTTIWKSSDKALDSKGAIATIAETSYATPMLTVLFIGLICYSIWRALQGFLDADNHGRDFKGLAVRGSLLISAFTHGALAFYVYKILEGTKQASDEGGTSEKVAQAMALPMGRWVVAAVGIIVVGFGVTQIIKAYKEKYKKYMTFRSYSNILDKVAKIGLSARAVVFMITGGYVIYAAWTADPHQSKGFAQAFTFLQSFSFGSFLTLIMAVGLIFFGIYSASEAIYRQINMKSTG